MSTPESGAEAGWPEGRHVDAEAVWRALAELVRDSADRFASTDPRNGSFYRRDAERFCERLAPHDEEESSGRFAEAAGLRERWGERFVSRLRRIAR